MELLRKIFATSVIFVTVLSMSAVAAPAGAAAQAGDLIKMDGLSTVYYLGADGKRYVFPNEPTFKSWYKDFSSVVTIPQSELESYNLGANVTVRPGTKLVKITTNPNVYAVEPGGNLRSIVSEANAIALWGANWAQRVIDVPDGFFTNYKVGTALNAGAYPVGTLLKTASSPDVFYFDGVSNRKFGSEAALLANRFDMANIITTSQAITAGGNVISGAEAALTDTSSGAGGVAGGGTGLTVSLAANTAPAGTVIKGQAAASLATFNFTASNDGAVVVTSLKVKKIGFAADAALANIYLYDGSTRLTDAGSLSSGIANFNAGAGLFTVPAGQTKAITVKSDIATAAVTTDTNAVGISISAASDIIGGGASISGSFPVNGNLMGQATADAATLGTIAMTATTTSVGASVAAGTNQAVVWSAPVTVGVKASNLKYLALQMIGTITADSLENIKLFINGTQAGTASTINANSVVIFDLSSAPARMEVGANTIEVRADVVKGSSRNFKFSLANTSDMVVTETGYGIDITLGATATFPATPVSATTISVGSVSVTTDSTLTTTQVVKGSSNVAIARFKMKAFGEDMRVQTLSVAPTITFTAGSTLFGEGLSNVSLIVNGSQVGSSKTLLNTASTTSLTGTLVYGTTNLFTIPAGQTYVVEVRGDLTQNATSLMTSVKADLSAVTNAFLGVTSVTTSNFAGQTGQAALTISTGSLTISKTAATQDRNITKNTSNVKIASYTLQATNAEAVRVTNVNIGLTGGIVPATTLSNLYITDNTTPIAPAASNNFSVNFTIPANGSHVIDVFADIGDAATLATTTNAITVTANGVTTNKSVGGTATGQTMTVQVGTLAAPTLVSNGVISALVVGGTETAAAHYKFVATNGDATINELKFNVTGAATTSPNTSAVSSVKVDTGSATVVCDGTTCSANITGLAIPVVAGTAGKTIIVLPTYLAVTTAGSGGSATRNVVKLNLVSFKATINNVQSADTVVDAPSNAMVLVAAAPVVAKASTNPASVGSGAIADADMEVMRFTVTVGAGQNSVNLKNVGFKPTYSALSSSTQLLKIYDSANPALSLGSASIGASGAQGTLALTADFPISAGTIATFILKADTTGAFGTAGNSFRIDLAAAGDTDATTGTNWQWNDSTAATYGNGFLVKDLPITGSTFTK